MGVYGTLPSDPTLGLRVVLSGRPALPVALSEPVMAVVGDCLHAGPARRIATAAQFPIGLSG